MGKELPRPEIFSLVIGLAQHVIQDFAHCQAKILAENLAASWTSISAQSQSTTHSPIHVVVIPSRQNGQFSSSYILRILKNTTEINANTPHRRSNTTTSSPTGTSTKTGSAASKYTSSSQAANPAVVRTDSPKQLPLPLDRPIDCDPWSDVPQSSTTVEHELDEGSL